MPILAQKQIKTLPKGQSTAFVELMVGGETTDIPTPKPAPVLWTTTKTPKDKGVPFAPVPTSTCYWPVRGLTSPHKRKIYFTASDGTMVPDSVGRHFMANRSHGARYHAGIDVGGMPGDDLVAIENGKIVNFYYFYEGTDALFVEFESGVVVNYGEIKPGSVTALGLKVGSHVKAGQKIATVGKLNSGSSMLHFETYKTGTTTNKRYMVADSKPPSAMYDPTKYLIHLAANGK